MAGGASLAGKGLPLGTIPEPGEQRDLEGDDLLATIATYREAARAIAAGTGPRTGPNGKYVAAVRLVLSLQAFDPTSRRWIHDAVWRELAGPLFDRELPA